MSVEPISDVIDFDRLRKLGQQAADEQRSLPCYQLSEAGDVLGAAAACEAVQAHNDCRWASHPSWCARQRRGALAEDAAKRLRSARVPKILSERVLASVPQGGSVRELIVTDALKLVRAFLSGHAAGVMLIDSATVAFTGSEWALFLAGPTGTGKSVAAAYAIARQGGIWLPARSLANMRYDLEDAEQSSLLVIDDLGTEYSGEGGFGIARAQALLELRHGEQRRTIVTTNLLRRRPGETEDEPPQFAERYGSRVDDRVREGGRFVGLIGASLRGAA